MESPMNITPPPSPPRLQSPPHEEDDDMPDLEEEAAEEAEAEEAPRTPENQRITSSAEPPDAPLRLRRPILLCASVENLDDLETHMLVLSADERMEPCAGFLLLLGGLTVIAYGAAAAAVYMGSF